MNLGIVRSLCAGTILGFALCGVTFAAPIAAQPQLATWMEHIMLVKLQNLPKNYSCYDLWYKFRDVLQKIGARPDWKITTHGCFFSGDAPARSPQVELRFYLPQALSPAQARWADVKAVSRTMSLRAGDGGSHGLDNSDCELLKQINDELLPALPVHVLDARLDCGSPAQRHHGYLVSVQALSALPPKPATPAQPAKAAATH